MPDRTIDIEVDKIYHSQKSSKQAALVAAWICGHIKGFHLKILDVTKISSLADYFVLADARNSVQARSIAYEISRQYKRIGLAPLSREGERESEWIVLDSGSVMIHIFVEPAREQYKLDDLYLQATQVPIPRQYYLPPESSPNINATTYF